MAYREVRGRGGEVLRRYILGESLRAIARGTAVDRKTVAQYLAATQPFGLHPGGPPSTEEQVVGVLATLQDVKAPGFRGLGRSSSRASR